jgi:hypothetical protein
MYTCSLKYPNIEFHCKYSNYSYFKCGKLEGETHLVKYLMGGM